MFARKSLGAVLATSLAGSVIAMTAGAASAAYAPDADDSKAAPVSADLIGVGSDTSQHALKVLADAWNGGAKSDYAATFDVATFSALGSTELPAPVATRDDGTAFTRPTGSGAGRAALYGTGRVSQVDFARSSGSPSQAEFDAGQRVIPFALDTVVPAVAGNNTHALASLTLAQLREIYVSCTMTTWADGTAIHPYVPKQGSGTEGFFKKQVLPIGTTSYGACVKDHTNDADPTGSKVQEHDPSLFTTDPLAIVPFSKGRAGLAGSAVKVVGGDEVAFKRNLYNVVRVEEMNAGAPLDTFFGSNGYVCSAAAHDLIKSAGFDQLASPAHGGDCGKVLNTASSNFTLNEVVATTTTLTGTSASAGQLTLTAKVAGSTAPVGKVTFTEGTKVLAANVPLVSGQATKAFSGMTSGAHTIKATYTPGDSIFRASAATATVTVKAPVVKQASRLAETFPARVGHGRRATGRVQITIPTRGNGTVKLYDGSRLLKTVTVRAGNSPLLTLPRLRVGRHAMKATWAGNAQYLASTLKFTITQR